MENYSRYIQEVKQNMQEVKQNMKYLSTNLLTKHFWRKPYGVGMYAQQSLASLPPLFVLFCLSSNTWYLIAIKVLSGIWLVFILLVHLFHSFDSDHFFGRMYRKNRAGYIFVMLCTALMLWNPNRCVFIGALAGFLFFSANYIIIMQSYWRQHDEDAG